jgi:hypothetical protein
MENIKKPWVRKILKILKWTFLVLICLFVVAFVWRTAYLVNKHYADIKTNAQIEKIHNTKLTLDDVMGTNLPPDPGALADQTVAGIDANNNGIRDDVELAIFNAYPKSAKTRAVLLQYALTLQMQMTLSVINKETVTATVEDNESRADVCFWNLSSRSDMKKFIADMDKYRTFVENLQLNNKQRTNYLNNYIYSFVGSYAASNNGCDLDLATLPN